jgi:hypothetical protein
VAKPGYGLFCEAAAAGTPVIYTARPDWPETPYLTAWLARHVSVFEVDCHHYSSQVADALSDALTAPRGIGAIGDGAVAAAHAILSVGTGASMQ